MPRLSPHLLIRARRIDPLLASLLRVTRTLDSATTELRWLRAHAATTATATDSAAATLRSYVYRRSILAEPLQYILGDQPFGPTSMLCRRGVLIPRAETEESASHLAGLLPRGSKVVDLCTGSGCISLLLAAETDVSVVGVDFSHHALRLSMENLQHNADVIRPASQVKFMEGDVLAQDEDELLYSIHACFDEMVPEYTNVDVVVSNPPYISADGYARETARSVRNWEPRVALEAADHGDVFYPRIGEIAWNLGARAVVAEVGGWSQAERVRAIWEEMGWEGSAIWKDFAGRGRTVVAWREGGEWIAEGPNPPT
ncbi:S-adenosyl-L-methionine-dependent methyltransferase [Tricharina praecox]|uniref:S-adenosyl-L-methionine-dependent methyltransferase n=1 Tax=Tricharina praecox TaxID=43433 RepID=UPI00221EAB5C|nr:S-adenosyl-L-methionine-dependent methyltransferase [Tricharina praecox]KAI5854873.1 S-adenosyl-L-methionine-dependent methyltransferase [Tricharina praecox]